MQVESEGPQRRRERAEQPELFEDTSELADAHVRVGKVEVEGGVAFGDVWLAWTMWRVLGLDDFCRRHLYAGREAVAWADIASILVIARHAALPGARPTARAQ